MGAPVKIGQSVRYSPARSFSLSDYLYIYARQNSRTAEQMFMEFDTVEF